MLRISSIGRPGTVGAALSKGSPDMELQRACWNQSASLFSRNRGVEVEAGGSLCEHLVPNQLRSSLEILVDFIVTTDMDYAENDVVLCYHGPLLYEAKVRLDVWWVSTRVLLRRLTRSFKRRDLTKTLPHLSMAPITLSITKAGRIHGTVRL